ncbi:Inactive serine/threonine-protein kinase TEX14 [Lonchura striata]|uniref:Inactive serine/threonine-protein kinase TEX14 n=1 Tax=Lonchura striata TaxID=40157 RepID=A0A218UV85_9PASE|nr:Inactive serine/threonine-protein kinase TEX14 [Lonchura striata domestica]
MTVPGVFVDAVNSMGQTCLFTAALLGLGKIVDVLLEYGSDVNQNAESPLGKWKKLQGQPSVARNIYSFGFGKFHLASSGHLGYLASLPIIGDKDVVQADDEPAFSYHLGPYMTMTNLVWGGSRVTVKELSFQPQQHSWKLRLADLLLAEQEHSSKLRHPHLLQLMSVCLSWDLERTRLVYERVHFGSLYSILHERRAEFPVLQTETIVHVLLQVLEALRFLHSRGFIHRSLSSFAIQIVSSGEAKLCNLEYMIQSKDSGVHSDLTRIPVPAQLFRWSSPEIILGKPGTVKSDVFSFCAVLQEALTESLPWKGVEDSAVKQLILSGEQLEADVRLPLLYYDVVKSGLEPKPRNRSMKLQDIQYILKNDLKDLVKSESGHSGGMPKAQRSAVLADVNICWASAFSFQKRTVEFQEEEKSKAGGFSAPQDSVLPRESKAVVVQEAAASAEPPVQDRSLEASSELQPGASPSSESEVDGSLCSFEMNEILASYPEGLQEFLEGGPGSGQALKDAEKQQKEDQSPWEGEEEGESSGSSMGFTGEEEEEELEEEEEEEEEEGVREASGLSQRRGDPCRRLSSSSQSEQHISKCVLNLKIMQSMLQQAGQSLSRTEEKLDRLKAMAKQKRLLQEVRMNLLPKESSQGRHWEGCDAPSQNTKKAFSGGDVFLHQAVAPPSRDYIPPPITCQAPGRDSFQAVPKTAKEREAIQNEKWKREIAATHHDPGCSVGQGLDDEVSLTQELKSSKWPGEWPQVGWGSAVPTLPLNARLKVKQKVSGNPPSLSLAEPQKSRSSRGVGGSQGGAASPQHQMSKQSLEYPFLRVQSFLSKLRISLEPQTLRAEQKLFVQDFCRNYLEMQHQEFRLQRGEKLAVTVRAPPHPGAEFPGPKGGTSSGNHLALGSVADIQDLSSIPCEQNFQRGVECKTPRLSHAPTSVSTPLGSEEKFPLAFEKYKQCREFSSDSSFCGSQETSSTVFQTFTTACEGERSMEIPVVAPRVCPFALKEPGPFLPPSLPGCGEFPPPSLRNLGFPRTRQKGKPRLKMESGMDLAKGKTQIEDGVWNGLGKRENPD